MEVARLEGLGGSGLMLMEGETLTEKGRSGLHSEMLRAWVEPGGGAEI
jgi:hypothetical protein